MLILLVFLAIIIGILLIFIYPKIGLFLLIFSSVFQLTYLHRWETIYISRFWAWIPFLLAGILLVPLLIKQISGKSPLFYRKSPIQNLYLFIIGMFCIGIFSCLLNRASPLIGIFGLRHMLLLVLLASFLSIIYSLLIIVLQVIRKIKQLTILETLNKFIYSWFIF